MDHHLSAQMFFCPKFVDVISLTERCTVNKAPQTVLQSGTNDVEGDDFNPNESGLMIN